MRPWEASLVGVATQWLNSIQLSMKPLRRLSTSWKLLPVILMLRQQASFNCIASDTLQIVNSSLIQGEFPQALKTLVIKPLLKKTNLDVSVYNYRPIYNLSCLSEIMEKVVFLQHFWCQKLFWTSFSQDSYPIMSQSAFKLSVLDDISLRTDSGKIQVLVLLDLIAAFQWIITYWLTGWEIGLEYLAQTCTGSSPT